ncbi:rhomboid family intramembrane serine protease [bacterium]|nr:rhomboid family intramembrane serine protease [bacterium]
MFPLYDESRVKGKWPFFTILLIIVNIAIFFYTFPNLEFCSNFYGFHSSDFLNGKIYTVFTSMFLHADIFHLLGNIWFLWVFGDNLEAKLGNIKFLLFYLFCGVFSALIYSITSFGSTYPVIGASGAISGVLGGYLIMFPRNKIKAVVPLIVWFLASIPATVFIAIWFVLQFVSMGSNDMVAYSGHIGGFLAGVLFVKKFKKFK